MAFNYPLKPSLRNVASRLARVQVLLVDPDRQIATLVRDVLKYIGFEQIHVVDNGQKAMEILKSQEIDLLITDWQMTPVDGVQLIRYLRSNPDSPNPYLPAIMLTGKAERHDVEIARDVGVTEFLVKPFSAKTLFERLVMVVENPRSFIVASGYHGPDRRRRMDIPPGGAERRMKRPVGEL